MNLKCTIQHTVKITREIEAIACMPLLRKAGRSTPGGAREKKRSPASTRAAHHMSCKYCASDLTMVITHFKMSRQPQEVSIGHPRKGRFGVEQPGGAYDE